MYIIPQYCKICKCFVPLHFETENKKKPSTSNQPDTLQQNSSPKSKQETATQFRHTAKATFPPWGLVTCIEVCNFSRRKLTALLVKNHFKKSKYTTVMQFRHTAKATLPLGLSYRHCSSQLFTQKRYRTACKKPFQNKEKHDCNAIQT